MERYTVVTIPAFKHCCFCHGEQSLVEWSLRVMCFIGNILIECSPWNLVEFWLALTCLLKWDLGRQKSWDFANLIFCWPMMSLSWQSIILWHTNEKCFYNILWLGYHESSFFRMKSTANVTKSLHQDCGLYYLHLPIFLLYTHSPLLLENKKLLWSLFFSAN